MRSNLLIGIIMIVIIVDLSTLEVEDKLEDYPKCLPLDEGNIVILKMKGKK